VRAQIVKGKITTALVAGRHLIAETEVARYRAESQLHRQRRHPQAPILRSSLLASCLVSSSNTLELRRAFVKLGGRVRGHEAEAQALLLRAFGLLLAINQEAQASESASVLAGEIEAFVGSLCRRLEP
jgi:hypothetical protein